MTSTRAVLAREMAVTTGSPALPVAMAVQMAVLLVFLLVWGGGVPTTTGATVLEQLLAVQWGALVIVLPWAAARSLAPGGGEGLALLSLLTGVAPRQILCSRLASVFVVLVCVGLAGLPFVVLAQQMTATPFLEVAGSLGPLLALATLVTAVGAWWAAGSGERMTVWIGTALTTAIAVWLTGRMLPSAQPWLLLALGAAGVALLAFAQGRSARKGVHARAAGAAAIEGRP